MSLDLSPLWGVLRYQGPLHLEQPGSDIVERRLRELSSKDLGTRRIALRDLQHNFPEANARLANMAETLLRDTDSMIRATTFNLLMAMPEAAPKHVDLYLEFLGAESEATVDDVLHATSLLAMCAPRSTRVEAALRRASKSPDRRVRDAAFAALQEYLARTRRQRGQH